MKGDTAETAVLFFVLGFVILSVQGCGLIESAVA